MAKSVESLFEITMFWEEHLIFRERVINTLQYAKRFYIAEGNESHSGKFKRDYQVPGLLAQLPDSLRERVVFVPVDLGATSEKNPFERERLVRDAALNELRKAQDFDSNSILIVQDFDEFLIPDRVRSVIQDELFSWKFWRKSLRIRQHLSYYRLNVMSEEDWTLGFMCLGSFARDPGFSANQWRHVKAKKKSPLSRTYLGWHHSYLGDVGFIRKKLQSFAEAEIDTFKNITDEQIEAALAGSKDLFGRDFKFRVIPYEELDPIPELRLRLDLQKK